MNKLRTAVTLACALALAGCGSQAVKPSFSPKLNAEPIDSPELMHRQLGLQALAEWQATENIQSLLVAERHLAKALRLQPDDLRLQQAYYGPLFTLAMVNGGQTQQRLEEQFQALHPLLRHEVSPPALAEYVHLTANRAEVPQRRAALVRGVGQQPKSARTWLQLSEVLDESEEYWLAVAAASTARRLAPDAAPAGFRLAKALSSLASASGCSYEQRALWQKAVPHLAQASTADPNNANYQTELAELYVRLGVFPLALSVSRKAVGIKSNAESQAMLGDVLYLSGRYEEAGAAYRPLYQQHDPAWGADRLTVLAAAQGDWRSARRYSGEAEAAYGHTAYSAMIEHWLYLLEREEKNGPDLAKLPTENEWQRVLVAFVANEKAEPKALLAQASSLCQRTEAHFHSAMRWWQWGEADKAREQLQQVIALKAYTFTEYEMAQALLHSGLPSR